VLFVRSFIVSQFKKHIVILVFRVVSFSALFVFVEWFDFNPSKFPRL